MKIFFTTTLVLICFKIMVGQKILLETNGLENVLNENLELNERKAQAKLSNREFEEYKIKIVGEIIDSLQSRSKGEIERGIEYLSFLTETDYRIENIDNPVYSINLIASPTFIEQAIKTGCTFVQARILATIELKWKEVLQEVEYLKKFESKSIQFTLTKELQDRVKTIVKLTGNIESISGISDRTAIDYNSHSEVKVYLKKVREGAQELRNLQNEIRAYLDISKKEMSKNERELKSALNGFNNQSIN